jgi:hypothetical protein
MMDYDRKLEDKKPDRNILLEFAKFKGMVGRKKTQIK